MPGAQLGLFSDRGQISVTGHIHFYNFIYHHTGLLNLTSSLPLFGIKFIFEKPHNHQKRSVTLTPY